MQQHPQTPIRSQHRCFPQCHPAQPSRPQFPHHREFCTKCIHPIEVPTTLPSGSDVGESNLRTEIDPMEVDDPHHGRVMEAPRPPLRLMCQVSDILADQHMSGGSDTESIDGTSEGEMFVVDPETVPQGPFVPGPVLGRRLNEGLASLDLVDLKEVFESRASVMRTVPLFLRGSVQRSHEIGPAADHQWKRNT